MRRLGPGVGLLALLLLATPVLAHVPSFPTDNTAPERAVEVPDAVKSWAFYDELDGGEVAYYRFSLAPGDRVRAGTFTPQTNDFTPGIVLLSPALNESAAVPPGVRVPDGMGAAVVAGERPDRATYEPFTPAANYHTTRIDRPVEDATTYLLAVYEPANRSGPVGVSLGTAEAFSLTEFLRVPFDLVRTHLWEGKHPLVAVGPFLLTLVGGALVLGRHRERSWSLTRLAVAAGGLLVLASGVNTLVQMVIALTRTGLVPGALVTAVFVVVPLVAGTWVVAIARRPELRLTSRTRIRLGVAGVAAFVTWAGFLLGPALLVAVALSPRLR